MQQTRRFVAALKWDGTSGNRQAIEYRRVSLPASRESMVRQAAPAQNSTLALWYGYLATKEFDYRCQTDQERDCCGCHDQLAPGNFVWLQSCRSDKPFQPSRTRAMAHFQGVDYFRARQFGKCFRKNSLNASRIDRAIVRILAQQATDQLVKDLGAINGKAPCRWRFRTEVLIKDSREVVALEWRFAGNQLEKEAAECI